MPLCSHFTKVKVEKIAQLANAVKRPDFCQQTTQAGHKMSDIWVCLDCGNQACSKYASSGCAQKHFVEQKHRLAIGINRLLVFCFECDDDLESILSEHQLSQSVSGKSSSNGNNNATQKFENFIDKAKQAFYKVSQLAQKKQQQQQQQLASEQQSGSSAVVVAGNKAASANQVVKLKVHPPSVFGLQNIGNTCFFNSVLQCLNGTIALERAYVISPECDFQEQIDVWDELNNEEEQFSSASSKNGATGSADNDDWCNITDKKSKKQQKEMQQQLYMQSAEKFTQMPLKKTNQIFQSFLVESRASKVRTVNPTSLFKTISSRFARFKTFEQQDAYDLLRCFLDSLIVGEEKWQKVNKSQEKVKGKMRNTPTESIFVKCLQCEHVSRSCEFFLDLALPVAQKVSPVKRAFVPLDILGDQEEKQATGKQQVLQQPQQDSKQMEEQQQVKKVESVYKKVDLSELKGCLMPYFDERKTSLWEPTQYTSAVESRPTQTRKLEQLFDEFFGFEQLNHTNYYKCEKCGKSQKQLKKFYLYEPPEVLTLVLKRFVQTGRSTFEKLNTHVDVPNIINIDPYTIVKGESDEIEGKFTGSFRKNMNYELFGIVSHSGSMNQGHYISFVKHIVEQQPHWFYYSDADVYETTWENVKTAQPYILFYKRV